MQPIHAAVLAASIVVIAVFVVFTFDVHGACMMSGLLAGLGIFAAWCYVEGFWPHGPVWLIAPMLASVVVGLHIGHMVGWRLTFNEWPTP